MIIREYTNGVLNKPFIVNWAEMTPTYVITSKQEAFRSPKDLERFLKELPKREGFVKINHVYCRDNAWFRAHYA